MTPAQQDDLLGSTVLGRYRILRKLARGGMGAVYLARTEGAEGFARPVVVKRALPTLKDDPEAAELFVREARILADLQHPNIVGVLDFGQQDDGSYVTVFEYVSGYSLAEWCRFLQRKGQKLPADLALHIVGEVLEALEYAHTLRRGDGKALQIVHRDVSPGNVLLNEQGAVKLVDFGIAQVSGQETALHAERPLIRGKLPYIPLEVFRGQHATVQSDVYAAGVVLYELLTGTNPFAGREAADILHKVTHASPASVHALRDDAPEDIDAVIARALDRDLTRRYRSAAELAAALRALRKEPRDAIVRALGDRVRRDFTHALPEALGLEPLSARDAAWRLSPVPDADDELMFTLEPDAVPSRISLVPADGAPSRISVVPEEVITVRAEISAELLSEAVRSQAPRAARSGRRVALVSAGVLLLAAVAAGSGFVGLRAARSAQAVVVVERRAAPQPAPPALAPAATAAAVAPVAPGTGSAPDPAAAAAQPEPAPQPAAPPPPAPEPLAPNPRALTRAFARRHAAVESCFDLHAASVQGTPQLSLHFSVGTRGQVLSAELSPAALAGTSLGRCLLEVANATRFQPQQSEISFHIPITAERTR